MYNCVQLQFPVTDLHAYRTIYLHTLPPHRLCLDLGNDENCAYAVAHIPVLPFNCSSPLWSLK